MVRLPVLPRMDCVENDKAGLGEPLVRSRNLAPKSTENQSIQISKEEKTICFNRLTMQFQSQTTGLILETQTYKTNEKESDGDPKSQYKCFTVSNLVKSLRLLTGTFQLH